MDNISSIFSKIEKNRFLKIFFRICINKIGRILIFRPEIGQKNLELEKTYLSLSQKISYHLFGPRSFFTIIFVLGCHFHDFPYEILFFQNLQNLSFLSIYTGSFIKPPPFPEKIFLNKGGGFINPPKIFSGAPPPNPL